MTAATLPRSTRASTRWLARATPEKYEKISEAELVARTNNAWSTPLVYQGKLSVKGRNELACYDIAGK